MIDRFNQPPRSRERLPLNSGRTCHYWLRYFSLFTGILFIDLTLFFVSPPRLYPISGAGRTAFPSSKARRYCSSSL